MAKVFKYILIVINLIFTIVVTTMLLASYFAAILPPQVSPIFSLLAIIAPLLVVLTFIAFLINAIRFKYIALYPLLVLVVGIGSISSIYGFSFLKHYDNSPYRSNEQLKVVSHNVRFFLDGNWEAIPDSTLNFISENSPSIMAVQEYNKVYDHDIRDSEIFTKNFVDYSISYNRDSLDKSAHSGLAIFSKFPIIGDGHYMFKEQFSGMQWIDVVVNRDTIRVFNVHLQSNGIDKEERVILSSSLSEDSKLDDINEMWFNNVFSKVEKNSILRASQADTLALLIEESPYPNIVCGDFNDVPFSYSYSKLKGDLSDSFADKGSGYAYSFNLLHNALKIDYILYDKDFFETISYSSPQTLYSDHNPIISTYGVGKK